MMLTITQGKSNQNNAAALTMVTKETGHDEAAYSVAMGICILLN